MNIYSELINIYCLSYPRKKTGLFPYICKKLKGIEKSVKPKYLISCIR